MPDYRIKEHPILAIPGGAVVPFTWKGEGAMPQEERERLNTLVRKAHAKGRLIRFWLTPDAPSPEREAVWRELLAADVDLINTDDLKGLQEFLLQHGR